MFIHIPLTHSFDYSSFVVSFEIRKCESSYFALLFQNCFSCSGSFEFPCKFFKKILFIYLEREEGKEKEREKHLLVAPHTPPHQGIGPQPRHVTDQELNQQIFALWDNAQPTDPYWSGLHINFEISFSISAQKPTEILIGRVLNL